MPDEHPRCDSARIPSADRPTKNINVSREDLSAPLCQCVNVGDTSHTHHTSRACVGRLMAATPECIRLRLGSKTRPSISQEDNAIKKSWACITLTIQAHSFPLLSHVPQHNLPCLAKVDRPSLSSSMSLEYKYRLNHMESHASPKHNLDLQQRRRRNSINHEHGASRRLLWFIWTSRRSYVALSDPSRSERTRLPPAPPPVDHQCPGISPRQRVIHALSGPVSVA